MGCFSVLKIFKKISEKSKLQNGSHSESVSSTRPRLQTTRSLHFRTTNPINRVTNRTRALSAPSALDAAEQDALATVEPVDAAEQDALATVEPEEEAKALATVEPRSPIPQPIPLPSPQRSGPLKLKIASEDGLEKFQVGGQGSKKRDCSSTSPLPALLPNQQGRGTLNTAADSVRLFQYEEIAAACRNFSVDRRISECRFSTIYKASFAHDYSSRKLKATVTCLQPSSQGLRAFMNEVNNLASWEHPNICKLLGFYACHSSEPRMVVYERLRNGSLDRLLFARSNGPSIDWTARMKIAICAAQGLTFMHEEGPFQAMYSTFSAVNIQIDTDFNAKLSGYGFVGHIAWEQISSTSSVARNLSVETLEKGMLTPKSHVWSFGIVLLELLTGRKNFDRQLPRKERNLVKWCRPFLADSHRLSVIMDSQLQGEYPPIAARALASLVQSCLQMEPSERPTMRAILENLKSIQDMQYSSWFPMLDPTLIYARQRSRSPNVNGARTSVSHHARLSAVPPVLHSSHACSFNISTEELTRQDSTNSSSS